MNEAKALTNINQPEKYKKNMCRCGSIKNLQIAFKDLPMWLAMQKARILALRMELSQSETKKAVEQASVEDKGNCLVEEVDGEDI